MPKYDHFSKMGVGKMGCINTNTTKEIEYLLETKLSKYTFYKIVFRYGFIF